MMEASIESPLPLQIHHFAMCHHVLVQVGHDHERSCEDQEHHRTVRSAEGSETAIAMLFMEVPQAEGTAGSEARWLPLSQLRKKTRRSALIVAAVVVGMPCGKPL
jgi:hypothetical protein